MAQPVHLPPDVAAALQRGNVIEAIKLLRRHHPELGLAEVKSILDALQKQGQAQATAAKAAARATVHRTPYTPASTPAVSMDPHLSPGEVPRTGSGAVFAMVIVAVLIVLGAAAYFNR